MAKTIQGMYENYLKLVSISLGKNIGDATSHLSTRGISHLNEEVLTSGHTRSALYRKLVSSKKILQQEKSRV